VNREFSDHTSINGAGTFGIGQRYLAGDESFPTIGKRFAPLNISATATEGNCRAYREQLFTVSRGAVLRERHAGPHRRPSNERSPRVGIGRRGRGFEALPPAAELRDLPFRLCR
jgi:hypothetical protein